MVPGGAYAPLMLGKGDAVPTASRVWTQPRESSRLLGDVLGETAGDGFALLCFYLFDWSPT